MTTLAAISTGTLIAIVVVVLFDVFVVVLAVSFLRARRAARAMEEAAAGGPAAGAEQGMAAPPDAKAPKLVSRREFFRKSWLASLGMFAAAFGASTIAFLWPTLKGGFGGKIEAGTVEDIKSQINSSGQPFYSGAGRFYIVAYDGTGKDEATGVDYEKSGYLAEGLMALYQRCVHLGCRVPFCGRSQWFECPCHGSKYNGAGEYKLGPAPTGMQRFKISVVGGRVVVDTSDTQTPGPPRGTDTTNQNPEGPFCV